MALLTKIRLARNAVGRGEDVTAQLAAVQTDAADLMADLRELAHGIHPPVLSDRGLVAAIEARADRLPVPVATSGRSGAARAAVRAPTSRARRTTWSARR